MKNFPWNVVGNEINTVASVEAFIRSDVMFSNLLQGITSLSLNIDFLIQLGIDNKILLVQGMITSSSSSRHHLRKNR